MRLIFIGYDYLTWSDPTFFLRASQKHFAGLVKPGIIQVMQKNLWRVASKFLPYLHILSHAPEISGLPLLSEIAV